MNFESALRELKIGAGITRRAWGGNGSIELSGKRITAVQLSDGYRKTWSPTSQDILAEDWEITVPPIKT